MPIVKNPNYKQIENLLAMRQEFVHADSMSARWTTWEGDTEYTVYSYRTPIARFSANKNGWTLNVQKYSVTTSKQQNMLRRAIQGQTVLTTQAGL